MGGSNKGEDLGFFDVFPKEFRDGAIKIVEEKGKGTLAVFDADWTLWEHDIGEAMLRFMSASGMFKDFGGAKNARLVWQHYCDLVKKDTAQGYAWACKVMSSLKEAQVKNVARGIAWAWPTYRPWMFDFIKYLLKQKATVYVVSASNRWVVESAMDFMGAPKVKVVAMEVQVYDGVLTPHIKEPIIYGEGKVQALMQKEGRMPDIACGDSEGDVPILKKAKEALLVVNKGSKMLDMAKKEGFHALILG
jgi:HAD superfamily phosphoserine phosphatase-like hydrolase